MRSECLDKLLKALGITLDDVARRLGGRPDQYLRAAAAGRLPFPVWDALTRFAHGQGWCWDPVRDDWVREQTLKV